MQPRKLRNAYLLFLMIFFTATRQRAFLFQQLYHFLITEEEFRVRRTNVAHDLGPTETTKRVTLMKESLSLHVFSSLLGDLGPELK